MAAKVFETLEQNRHRSNNNGMTMLKVRLSHRHSFSWSITLPTGNKQQLKHWPVSQNGVWLDFRSAWSNNNRTSGTPPSKQDAKSQNLLAQRSRLINAAAAKIHRVLFYSHTLVSFRTKMIHLVHFWPLTFTTMKLKYMCNRALCNLQDRGY